MFRRGEDTGSVVRFGFLRVLFARCGTDGSIRILVLCRCVRTSWFRGPPTVAGRST